MTRVWTAVSIAALAAAAGVAYAGEAETQAATPQGATVDARQGLRVVRDKDTGALRLPSQEELEAMLQQEREQRIASGLPAAQADPAAVVVRHHSDGSMSAVLGPEFLISVQVQRGADERLVFSHDKPGHEHPRATAPNFPTE